MTCFVMIMMMRVCLVVIMRMIMLALMLVVVLVIVAVAAIRHSTLLTVLVHMLYIKNPEAASRSSINF